jgi:hypothetical protein
MQAHLPAVHVPVVHSEFLMQAPPTAAAHGEPVRPAQQGIGPGIAPSPVHAQTLPLQADPGQHVPFAQPVPSGRQAPATHTPPLHAPVQQLAFSWHSAPTSLQGPHSPLMHTPLQHSFAC